MIDNLKRLLNNSYAPISGYHVAAIIKCTDGQEFVGVNVENADGRSGLCAEQVAIGAAFTAGYKHNDFAELYVMGSGKNICMPCFMCRELICEYFRKDAKIVCYNKNGKMKEYTYEDICPHPFESETKR